MKARISQLYKTEAEWAKLPNFVPMQGELIIFSPDKQHTSARLKIGDGQTLLKDLSFFTDPKVDNFLVDTSEKIIDAGRITDYKK